MPARWGSRNSIHPKHFSDMKEHAKKKLTKFLESKGMSKNDAKLAADAVNEFLAQNDNKLLQGSDDGPYLLDESGCLNHPHKAKLSYNDFRHIAPMIPPSFHHMLAEWMQRMEEKKANNSKSCYGRYTLKWSNGGGIGTVITVKDTVTGEKIDVTDVSNW